MKREEAWRASTEGAEWGEVWGGVSPPQPTMGSGGASLAPPAGPRPETHLDVFLAHRTRLAVRKMRWLWVWSGES